jgi:hypothetical protein
MFFFFPPESEPTYRGASVGNNKTRGAGRTYFIYNVLESNFSRHPVRFGGGSSPGLRPLFLFSAFPKNDSLLRIDVGKARPAARAHLHLIICVLVSTDSADPHSIWGQALWFESWLFLFLCLCSTANKHTLGAPAPNHAFFRHQATQQTPALFDSGAGHLLPSCLLWQHGLDSFGSAPRLFGMCD